MQSVRRRVVRPRNDSSLDDECTDGCVRPRIPKFGCVNQKTNGNDVGAKEQSFSVHRSVERKECNIGQSVGLTGHDTSKTESFHVAIIKMSSLLVFDVDPGCPY